MASKPGAGWASPAVFQLGKGKTLAVPMEVHEIARKKVVKAFSDKGITSGVVLLKGGEDQNVYDTDTEMLFRQDSWFNYLFGVKESYAFGAISLSSGKTTLFIAKHDSSYRIWCGEIYPPSHFLLSYGVDEVLYTEDLASWVEKELSLNENAKLHLMRGVNSDSGSEALPATFKGDAAFADKRDYSVAYGIIELARVTKCPEELDVMRYAAWVASNAHVAVMRSAKDSSFEYELEATFLYEIYKNGGCRKSAYTSICACGPNAATLHYGHAGAPNEVELRSHQIALLDMGAEYHGYVSDITCSFPLSGTFSDDQRAIYEGVLNAQRVVYAHMLPGTLWSECHRLAEIEIVRALLAVGVLHNGSLEEVVDSLVGAVFFPHGLGHLIGCDTHDVGGYTKDTPLRSTRPGFGLSKLRTGRVLEAGMVLTNEPGCYFIDALIDEALADPSRAKYMNVEVIDRFRNFGGVRLEDVVTVTEQGADNLTTCPRTVKEIESVLAGGVWPPKVDEAPELKRRWFKLAPKGHGMIESPL